MTAKLKYQQPAIKLRSMISEQLLITMSSGSQDNDQALSKGMFDEEDIESEQQGGWY
jgi:hypothetical protein